MIEDIIRHVRKIYHDFFYHYFDRIAYLIIKIVLEIQNYIENKDGKLIKYIFNVYYDVHYHPANCHIKIQLVYGEINRTNCIMW